MSNSLTEPAPTSTEATPPVGDQGSPQASEVGNGSVPAGFIPEDRFNGLMSSFNQAQAEAQARANENAQLTERLTQLEQQLASNQTKEPEDMADANPQVEALTQQIEALTALVQQQAAAGQEAQMEQVWNEFEVAKPFKDLFVANDAEELRGVVSVFAERLQPLLAGAAPAAPAAGGEPSSAGVGATGTPSSPVDAAPSGGGGVGAPPSGGGDGKAQLKEAIAKRDVTAYLAAKALDAFGDEDGLALSPSS